jgi:hypothetical protein
MASQTLADPFSQRVVHTVKHDLEGFWWSTFFVALNCQGPYGRLVDWRDEYFKKGRNLSIRLEEPGEPCGIDMRPPNWLRNGVQKISYQAILAGRLQSLGNWLFFEQLVLDFWHDRAILDGLKEMFDIFMPSNLTMGLDLERKRKRPEGASPEPRIVVNDAAIDVTHEKMIDIVKRILDKMVDEPAPSRTEVEEARKRYGERLQYDFLSPEDGTHSRPPSRARSASRESQRRGGIAKPSGVTKPTKRPITNQRELSHLQPPSDGTSFHLFHSSGSPDSPHFHHTDMGAMPSVAAANRIYSSSVRQAPPLTGHKRPRLSVARAWDLPREDVSRPSSYRPTHTWTTAGIIAQGLSIIDEGKYDEGDEGEDYEMDEAEERLQ